MIPILEPPSRYNIEKELRLKEGTAIPEKLKDLDVVLFREETDLVFLKRLFKPSLFYNHRSARPVTFMFNKIVKYKEPLDRAILRKDRKWIIKKFKELLEEVDVIVSNSKFTQANLKKYFGLDSFVVNPPVDLEKFKPCKNPTRDYFFSYQRLFWQKRILTQVKAFKGINEKLIIETTKESGRHSCRLQRVIPQNVMNLPTLTDKELVKEIQNAKAVIQTCMEEDFGLVPVEAMACGTPVIVVDEGGFKETVHSPKLGIRIKPPYVKNLRKAVLNFDSSKYDSEILRKEAEKYSSERFKKEMKKYLQLAIDRFRAKYHEWFI